ncbi:MAG: CDP-paratose 2-epimerase [Anaerolineae bacterium CG_4_9_14_3_um_filter_57_17]|nr:NAD-dependent epimerase/dehydratase family protein [bacterium]NCT20715.1 NAD-dependent epimerase/dehydratase family protein [bacterium]OIO86117.1 MAG: CDP-paratose 2-epimerase [Anaerolineae bacterium CG2_30_57_67]PJB67705.1 MAG: CDP-paratose 2-epimerase [Anaerolineae bacterium CG_4_9_14_3_um_filter_57_17]
MSRNYFITGGAGFIGSNFVHRLLERGEKVTIYDNLSRAGAPRNLKWLQQTHGPNAFNLVVGDVRDAGLLAVSAREADVIVHLAGQVAVTTSVVNPREDFEINALGTFNVLEAARLNQRNPVFLYASTNKVYGGMDDVAVIERPTRWKYESLPFGASEAQPLDFHSPYGCSKGTGDQYVRDYFRIYGLPSVVLRQSCIYGPRQFGVEDQGWVAWFVIAAITGRPLSIYGDGKQVRDLLHVYDLLDAYDLAIANIERVKGQVFNLGGGASNTISIWNEFAPLLENLVGHALPITRGDWRPGDQKVFVADIRKAAEVLGWRPKFSVETGVKQLFDWVSANRALF